MTPINKCFKLFDCVCALKVVHKNFQNFKNFTCKFKFDTIYQAVRGQEGIGLVIEVLEKWVEINWRTLAVPFVAIASSSQSF